MAQVLLVRHAQKGNGKETGKKFHLSPVGQQKALDLGGSLPEEFTSNIRYVGGSEMSRSLHAALLIAMGAGCDPQILASDQRLGSEDLLFNGYGLTIDNYVAAVEKHGGSEVAGLKEICSFEQYASLNLSIFKAIEEALQLDGNVILGTHSPWLQIAIEAITGENYHANVSELDWILIDTDQERPVIIASQLS
jgi:broad specificity phosphatase PhoE